MLLKMVKVQKNNPQKLPLYGEWDNFWIFSNEIFILAGNPEIVDLITAKMHVSKLHG